MPEESHLEEMDAAIRAQRARRGAPRSMLSGEDATPPDAAARRAAEEPVTQPTRRRGLLARLLRR